MMEFATMIAVIERFSGVVAPRMLAGGQGYASEREREILLEAAWYQDGDTEWSFNLALEDTARRCETPPGSSFACSPGFTPLYYEIGLQQSLNEQFLALFSAPFSPEKD